MPNYYVNPTSIPAFRRTWLVHRYLMVPVHGYGHGHGSYVDDLAYTALPYGHGHGHCLFLQLSPYQERRVEFF